jgi:hypothetical protein
MELFGDHFFGAIDQMVANRLTRSWFRNRRPAYSRQEGFEYLGDHRINLVDLPELACDLSVAGCIEEVTQDRVSVRVHVGAFAISLQRSKLINGVLLSHGALDLRFGRNRQFNLPSLRFDTKLQVSSRPAMASNRPCSRRPFRRQLTSQSPR